MTKLEEFSSGYYRAEMSVQPFSEGPAIERGLYDLINRNIYHNTDAPVTMRLGLNVGPTFRPRAENAMPTDVLAAPEMLLENAGIHPSEEAVNVFIYKPAAAHLFNTELQVGASPEEAQETLSDSDLSFFNLDAGDE